MRIPNTLLTVVTLLLALATALVVTARVRSQGIAEGARVETAERLTGAERLLASEGRLIAEQWCAGCHAIGTDAQGAALSDAPSFKLLAEEPYLDGDMLYALRTAPHPAMPEFPLTRRSAKALAIFIRSVRSDEPYDPYGTWKDRP